MLHKHEVVSRTMNDMVDFDWMDSVVTDQKHSWTRCSTRGSPDARAGGQTLN